MADLDTIVDQLSNLSVIETAELVQKLEEKWGVSAAAPVAAAPAGGGEAAAAPAEEKTEFDAVLTTVPSDKKIATIKAIREIKEGLGLAEAKKIVEELPKPLLEGVTKEEADAAKKKIEEAGATVEVK